MMELFLSHLFELTDEQAQLLCKKSGYNYADTILKHIETLGLDSWKNIFSKNTVNAKELGLLPNDIHVVRKTLEGYGFVIQSRKFTFQRPDVILDCIDVKDCAAYVIFASCSQYFGLFTSMVMKTNEGVSYFDDLSPKILNETGTAFVWIRYLDGVDRSPAKRRKVKFRPLGKHFEKGIDNECFKHYQPNPMGNNTGDCVVRALAGVMQDVWGVGMKEAWYKALDNLCEPSTTTVINYQDYFIEILKKLGFAYMKPSEVYDGKKFCQYLNQTFHNGERVFAFVGEEHVAAIVPVDGVYKILDFQDTSSLNIPSYWISGVKEDTNE